MAARLQLSTFAIGSPREGTACLRIAVARRPQRGVRRAELRVAGVFDSWLPQLAPSQALLRRTPRERFGEPGVWEKFAAAYRREMAVSEQRHLIALLAELAQRGPISVGCFCAKERHCHRRLLQELIVEAAVARAL